jgi:signal transduction histidine kinase
VRALEREKRRAEALAEIDRAKTAFFSNASHEFRTPLTLMLSPLEDILLHGAVAGRLSVEREQIELVRRNGLRLLKLVNALLDFSRLEAGKIQAHYEPIDIAAYTAELASTFQSAMDRPACAM